MKKSTKGLMSALLLMAMCGAVGCGNKESSPAGTSSTTSEAPVSSSVESSSQTPSSSTSSEEVNATTDLLTQVEDGGQGVYNVTNADGKTTLAFNKTNADEHIYAFAKVDLGSLAHKDQMRTLRFTVSGAGKLEMKFEGSKGSKAITFLVYETKGYYEWNLTAMGELDEKIAAADKLLFFAQPGSLGSGEIVFDELTITTDFAGEDSKYTIVNDGWTNIVAGSNVYDGASATFDFNRNWVDNDGTVHTFEYVDDTTVVTYTKSDTYQFASTEISGDYGKFEYINFKVKGTSGDAVLFKVEGNRKSKEMTIPFDGNEQTYTLDLRGFTREERQAFNKVLMFAAPGNKDATGTYTVIDAYYSSTFDGTNFEYPTNIYDGVATSFNVNANWHDSGDGVYKLLNDVSPFEVSYDKGNYEYPALRSKVSGDFGNFKKLTFGLELPVGKSAIVKVEGDGVGKEITVDGAGDYAFGTLDLSDLTVTQRNNITKVLIMVEPAVKNVTGTFKIHHIGFEDFEAQVKENKYVSGEEFNVNAYWKGDALYNITEESGKTTIAWEGATSDNRWTNVNAPISGDLSVFGELQYKITIPAGTSTLVKLNGCQKELGFLNNIAGAEAKEFTGYFDLSNLTAADIQGITGVLLFPIACDDDTPQPATGTIVVSELKFVRGRTTVATDGTVDIKNASWFGGAALSSEVVTDGVKISYTNGSWDTYKFRMAPVTGFTKVVVEFTGLEGTGAILKLETEGVYSGVEEKFLNEDNPVDRGFFTGEKQTAEMDITGLQANRVIRFMVFAEPTQTTPAAGSITIHSITFVA